MFKNKWILWIGIALFSTSMITACGSDDDDTDDGVERDAGTDTGGTTDPDTGGAIDPDTGGTTDPDTGGTTDPDTGGTTDPDTGGNACDNVPIEANAGGSCAELSDCANGICAQTEEGATTGTCFQLCTPGLCETTCGEGSFCRDGVENPDGSGPLTLPDGTAAGICQANVTCDDIPVASNAGTSCNAPEDCGSESVCIDGTCLQFCSPGNCEDFCSATEACQGLANQDGTPATLPGGLAAGACFDVSDAPGPFEACTNSCQAGSECAGLEENATVGTCLPQCGGGETCPTVEGFASECSLGSPGSTGATSCAIQCTAGDDTTCPSGRVCIPMGEGGVCGNR